MRRRPREQPETARGETTDGADGAWLAGYRVLRRLGAGSRATVYLGHAGESNDAAPAQVALKVFSERADRGSIDVELEALDRVESEHVVKLIDVDSGPERPTCLVLERLDATPVAAVLGSRTLLPGEAVTIAISVCRGVCDLLDAGFSHEALRLGCVFLAHDGRPVVAGLGHAAALGRGRSEQHDAERRCLAALAELVDDLALFLAPGDRAHFARTVAWMRALSSTAVPLPGDWRAALEERLFSSAAPRALIDAALAVPRASPERVRYRTAVAGEPAAPLEQPPSRKALREPEPGMIASGIRRVASAAHGLLEGRPLLSSVRASLLRRLAARRRPLIVASILGGGLLVLVLALVPPSAAHESARGSASARAATPAPSVSGGAPARTSGSKLTAPPRPGPTANPAIAADDPVAAATALLGERRACLSRQDAALACLDGVDDALSPLLESDRRYLGTRAAQTARGNEPGSAVTYDGYAVSLIQRTGGSALIELAPPASDAPGRQTQKPASLLVIQGETGWRLREIFAD
ncbi:protein kinase [Microbacterium sp. STN6]|uniref:protein kinase n=1 Tax=Microbacterium sp. STN6 TaxID=2995588 RepID=UPI002260A5C5|nr:protein kinase [Microbacterium sp. STN6]MCX7522424.1 protein kinase [Microbacterium sp. STN6]